MRLGSSLFLWIGPVGKILPGKQIEQQPGKARRQGSKAPGCRGDILGNRKTREVRFSQ